MEKTNNSQSTRRAKYLFRIYKNIAIVIAITFLLLGVGMWGYHYFEGLTWVDSYANAAMILSGMGPLHDLSTTGGRLFAGTYALFSGLVYLVVIAIIFSPVFHFLLHTFHVEESHHKD